MSEFAKALAKLPPPIPCFSNGAPCPWCGHIHKSVTFGENECQACVRAFWFGYPQWHVGKDPVSYVPFPHREFDALGQRADLMLDWEPTDLLKHHYHQIKERETGIATSRQ